MHIIKTDDKGFQALPVSEINKKFLKNIGSELAIKIMQEIKKKELYPKQIANLLGEHEQKIYYHIKNLERAGLIIPTKTERVKGSFAKYYKLVNPAFFFKFEDFRFAPRLLKNKEFPKFLEPFITNGQLDSLIITGSPDPHGPDKARSRDGYYGIDLGLFLGTFLVTIPHLNVKLDTEIQEGDLRKNLILIGGPVVNKITEKINSYLPVNFDKVNRWSVYSTLSKNSYPQDEVGIIVKSKNPFNPSKSILLIAGKRYSGTKAALIGIINHFKEITDGNIHNNNIKARIVEGMDLDSDGQIDAIEFRE